MNFESNLVSDNASLWLYCKGLDISSLSFSVSWLKCKWLQRCIILSLVKVGILFLSLLLYGFSVYSGRSYIKNEVHGSNFAFCWPLSPPRSKTFFITCSSTCSQELFPPSLLPQSFPDPRLISVLIFQNTQSLQQLKAKKVVNCVV